MGTWVRCGSCGAVYLDQPNAAAGVNHSCKQTPRKVAGCDIGNRPDVCVTQEFTTLSDGTMHMDYRDYPLAGSSR